MDLQGMNTDISLNQLMGAFNSKIAELQQLILTRGVESGEFTADLSALDVNLTALEQQLVKIKTHVKEEMGTVMKARTLIELSKQQQQKIEQMSANFPAELRGAEVQTEHPYVSSTPSGSGRKNDASSNDSFITPATKEKEKKGKGPPPRCYVTAEEFSSLSSYMRGRLTLDKINIAIDDMATFAESNARLLATQRRKLGEDEALKVLELREIAFTESIKGKHFFLEGDMKGQVLKLDTTGKAIITILRHLGRTSEARIGKQRVFTLMKV